MKISGVYASEADLTGAQKFATPASVDKPSKGRKLGVFRRGLDVVVLLWGVVKAGTEIAARFNGVDVLFGIAECEVIEDVVH